MRPCVTNHFIGERAHRRRDLVATGTFHFKLGPHRQPGGVGVYSADGEGNVSTHFLFFTSVLSSPFHQVPSADPPLEKQSTAFSLPVSDAHRRLAAGQLAAKRRREAARPTLRFPGGSGERVRER